MLDEGNHLFRASFASLLALGLELFKDLSESGDITLLAVAPAMTILISIVQTTYETYHEACVDYLLTCPFPPNAHRQMLIKSSTHPL